jgi:hypothetical protein
LKFNFQVKAEAFRQLLDKTGVDGTGKPSRRVGSFEPLSTTVEILEPAP